jgi:tRNA(Ile)-lysidine synthase
MSLSGILPTIRPKRSSCDSSDGQGSTVCPGCDANGNKKGSVLSDRFYFTTRSGLGWIEDPSNDSDRFERVKTRKALVHLAGLGVTTDVLTDVTLYLSQAHQALDIYTRDVARQILTQIHGDVILDWRGFQTTPQEVRRRLLIAALQWVSGAGYPPRSVAVQHLETAITGRNGKTLSGCQITCSDTAVRIFREFKAVKGLKGPTNAIWDKRWSLIGPHAPGLEIRALGESGLRLCAAWRTTGLPRTSLLSSPAVWRGETLIAAPLAGFNDAWQARIVADFHATFALKITA